MVILVILAGIYLIGVFGYYKMIDRINQAGLNTGPLVVPNSILLFMSCVWPVMIYYALVKEALQ